MTAAAIKINRTTAKKVLKVVDAGLSSGLGNPKPGEMCVEAAVCFALGLPHNDDPGCVSPALRSLKITLNDKAWSSNEARAKGMRRLAIAQLGTMGELDDKVFVAAVAEMTIRTFVPIALRAAASANPKHADKLEDAAKRCEKEGTRDAAYAAYASASASADAAYAASAYASDASASASADAADAAYAASAYAYAAYAASASADAAYASASASASDAASASASAAAAYAAYAYAYAAYAAYAATAAERDRILSQFAEAVVQILIKLGVKATAFLDLAPL